MNLIPGKYTSFRSIRALKFIFSGIVIFLILASFYTYNSFTRYAEDVELRILSTQMIRALNEIEVEVLKAETGHRGYQLTGNAEYLQPYQSTKDTIFHKLDYLDSLSLNATLQHHRIDSLKSLVQRQYSIIEEIISLELHNQGEPFSQYEINLLSFGSQNMEIIRILLNEIEEAETDILNKRISRQETKGKLIPILLTIFNILALAVIIYVFFYIYRLLKEKTDTEEELRQRQVQLIEAERMVNIGNWSWDIKSDRVQWSEGLYQIFKKPPLTFVPEGKTFRDNLHPDDKELVSKIIDNAIVNKEPYNVNCRIKLNDGSIRYLYVIGNPQLDEEGELKSYFGVTQDISLQKSSENKILQQSEELKRSNEDLEQFAYVASHDLQEPLRKIRAFGDRLETKYKEQLEGSGADYIYRMKNAAERMQGLINDLLTFSRVSRNDQIFAKHSLDKIVDEVLEDLETRINENNVRIEREELPEIICNELGMKRLFQNIIGNAIKFKKPDVDPVVTISCKKFRASELEEEFPVKGNRQYYKIMICDNGIGFNEKYQERIFNIFQRLHGRGDYKGTGIGLAICRKIVSNHEGFIHAEGEENKGAKFIILLPKNIKKDHNPSKNIAMEEA